MTREDKLEKLNAKKAGKEFTIMTNGEEFIEALETKIAQFKKALGEPVTLKGVDTLIEQLAELSEFTESVEGLNESVKSLHIPDMPDSVEVTGLDTLVKAIRLIPDKQKVDVSLKADLTPILNGLDKVTEAVKTKAVKQSQTASDYIPYRRVVKVGNSFFFDDNMTGTNSGSGGGGSSSSGVQDVLIRNGDSIAVVNPDGTPIQVTAGDVTGTAAFSDSGDVEKKGLVDADRHVQVDVLTSALPTGAATSAKQDTGNTSLSSIDTKIDALTTPSDTQPISHAALTELAAAINTDKLDVNIASGNITGFATSANQTTIIGHLDGVETLLGEIETATDGIEGLLTTIDGDTGSIATSNTAIQAAVEGTLDVNIVGGSSSGTEYTEGDIDASITGTAILWEDGSDTLRAVSASKPLPVDLQDASVAITAATLPLPSGASTSANQTTIIGHVDGIEGALTTLNANDFATEAKQDDIITAIEGITVDPPVGGATLAEQEAQTALLTTIESNQLPDGHNVTVDNASIAVTGTFWQATQPVSGTVAVTHAALTELAAAIDTEMQVDVVGALPAGNNNIGDVDVASSALPTGASTSAKQDTIIGHVDGIEGLLTTIDGDTGNISTKIDTLAGAVSGTEFQVDVLTSALPTGASTASKQDDIITAIEAIPGGGGEQHATNEAYTDADLGTVALSVRDDALATLTEADGDYSTLRVTSTGRLWASATIDAALPAGTNAIGKLAANSGVDIGDVDVTSSALPTGASTSAKQDTIIGHLDGVEGLLTDIEADTDTLAVVGGGVEATALRVTIANDSTGVLSVDDNGGTLTVDNAGLTELAGAINASAQMDVNLAASNATVTVSNAGLTELAAAINSSKVDINLVSSDISFGGTSAADDADFTDGTTPGTPAMGVYESTPSTVTDGDLGVVGITEARRLKTSATIDAALPAGTNNIGDVDVLSSALPTGASTSAKQDTIIGHLDGVEGLLGTIDADTGTIAGAVSGSEMQVDIVSAPTLTVNAHAVTNAGTFAVQVDGNALTALQLLDDTVATLGTTTYTEASTKANVIGAIRRDADTTLVDTTNEVSPLQVDANGRLKVEAFSGETLPVSLASVPSHAVTNAGTFAVQVDGNALTALQLLDDTIFTDDAGFTPGTSKVSVAGFQADEASTDSVDEGDAGAARMTLDRKQIVTTLPHTSGGATIFRSLDLDETEEEVKATAGQLYGYFMTNLAASTRYIKFYNATAANVTVGTTTPVLTIPLEADQAANVPLPFGVQFDTAITVAATTGIADNDTGAPGANEVVVNLFYK